jgi:hypothetical protein
MALSEQRARAVLSSDGQATEGQKVTDTFLQLEFRAATASSAAVVVAVAAAAGRIILLSCFQVVVVAAEVAAA